MAKKKTKMVIVCTEKKGVFFGELVGEFTKEKTVLKNVQMCVYWSADVKGILGLTNRGPTKNCRVTPVCPEVTLLDCTAYFDVTEQAIEAWRSQPWG